MHVKCPISILGAVKYLPAIIISKYIRIMQKISRIINVIYITERNASSIHDIYKHGMLCTEIYFTLYSCNILSSSLVPEENEKNIKYLIYRRPPLKFRLNLSRIAW